MTPFMKSVLKKVKAKRNKVHKLCQKIANVGNNGGKYFVPLFLKQEGKSIR